jgi:hypothetical protein
MSWALVILEEVREWLRSRDRPTRKLMGEALAQLEENGPGLARPLVDTISGSRINNLKELRPGSTGRSEVRLLFVFDPARRAVILVGGDKAGQWRRWYDVNIPLAEERYEAYLAKMKEEEP